MVRGRHRAQGGLIGAIAVQHHERLDGSGYPRGLSGDAISPAGRILVAADTHHAMTELRPHRPARSSEEAVAAIRTEVTAGRLDGDAVNAVLRAAGHQVRARRDWPAGLTGREIEVLKLVACGFSNKEIAEQLVISRKTAGNHVDHIYTKIGASTRARASQERLGALAGVAFSVLILLGVFGLAPNQPSSTATTKEIVTYIHDHQNALSVGNYLEAFAVFWFLWFAASLSRVIATAKGGIQFAALSLGAAVILVALILVVGAAEVAITQRAFVDSDVSVQTLYLFSEAGGALLPFPIAAFIGGATVVALDASVLPRWLGYFGCLIAALELLCGFDAAVWSGPLALDGAISQLSFPAFVVWVLAACVALLARMPAARAESR